MFKKIISIFTFLLFTLITCNLYGQADDNELKKAKSNTTATDSTKEIKHLYQKLLNDSEHIAEGFIDIYDYENKIYLEIPLKLLGKDMLIASTISKISNNRIGTVGAKHTPLHIEFTKVDSTLLLHKITDNAFVDNSEKDILGELIANNMGAVIKMFKIKTYNKDSTAAVIEATDYFLSDKEKLSPFGTIGLGLPKRVLDTSFEKSNSFIKSFESFGDNLTIRSSLSYRYSIEVRGRVYAEDEPFTAVMTRTLMLLPEDPMQPRIADSRIGIFTTNKYRYSDSASQTKRIFFAKRFQLIPNDKEAYLNGELVEPVQPIVFYVDKNFPESWIEPVKKGIEDWNRAFRKIGFKNAVVAKMFPEDDPKFDPDNLKFNVVRYAPLSVPNAMGPSWIDPRTGEILNASVYVYHNLVKLLNNWMFIQISPADKAVRSTDLPKEYLQGALRYVIRHEIGHTLGFMHNMAGSSPIPVDSLRSPSFTQKYGITYSIMDYARYNYVAQPGDKQRGVALKPPILGVYDYYLVKWNYKYFPDKFSWKTVHEKLTTLIDRKAGDTRYMYGPQFDFLDPRSLTEDLGKNAVKASTYGIQNLKYIMDHLNEWVGEEDYDYTYRLNIWNGIIAQYTRYINHVLANLGGIYTNRVHVGDPLPHYRSVPREVQERALQFLIDQISNMQWITDEDVLRKLPLTGTPVKALQKNLVDVILKAPAIVDLAAKKSDAEIPYSPAAVLKDIYRAVWQKTKQNKPLNKNEMQFQLAFIENVITESELPTAGGGTRLTLNSKSSGKIKLPSSVKRSLIDAFGMGVFKKFLSPINYNSKPVSAFNRFSINFRVATNLQSLYYHYLLKIKSLLEQRVKTTTDNNTRLHYKLMLHKIENAIQ